MLKMLDILNTLTLQSDKYLKFNAILGRKVNRISRLQYQLMDFTVVYQGVPHALKTNSMLI